MALKNTMAVIDGNVVGAPQSNGPTWEDNNTAGSKNLNRYPYSFVECNTNGITAHAYEDGTIIVNGTATATTDVSMHSRAQAGYVEEYNLFLPNGKYIISGCADGGKRDEKFVLACSCTKNGSSQWLGYCENSTDEVVIEVNGDDYNTDGADVGFFITIWAGTTLNNLVFKPMIRKFEDPNGTYEAYGASNQYLSKNKVDWEANSYLGAKNIIPFPYRSAYTPGATITLQGVTLTVNDDGSMTLDGTCSADSSFEFITSASSPQSYRIADELNKHSNWIFSGDIPSNLAGYTSLRLWGRVYTSNSLTTEQSFMIDDFGQGDNLGYSSIPTDYLPQYKYGTNRFEIPGTVTIYGIRMGIAIFAGVTYNNVTIKPMLRVAEDPDGTFKPYAMTNQQLSKIATPKKINCTLDSTKVTQGVLSGCQIGPIVILHLDAVKLKTSGSPLKINSSVLPRPVSGRALSNIRAGSQVSSSTSGSDMLSWVDSDGNVQVSAIADNVNYYFYGTYVYVTDQY